MKRVTMGWSLVFAVVVGLLAPLAAVAQDAALDCSDFATQEGAQAVLELTPDEDVADALDPDGDGQACEDLPSRDDTGRDPNADDDDDFVFGQVTATPDEPEPTEEPTARATAKPAKAKPLDARLGGTRKTFEDEYGESVGGDGETYPIGFDYDVKGFDNVNVYYIKEDLVGYLTLTADSEKPWSGSKARQVVEPFLPTDAELGKSEKTDDGDSIVVGHSKALEKPFGKATFDKYGATGDPGDFYYVMRLDDDNKVQSIEVALGDSLQTISGLTEEEQAYYDELRRQFDSIAKSMDDFDKTLTDLTSGAISPEQAGTALARIFNIWRGADQEARQKTPPASVQATHDLYLEFTGLLAGAADDYANGLINNNQSLLASGDQKYSQATILRTLLDVLISAATGE